MVTLVYFAASFLARILKYEDRRRKTAMCETPSSAQSPIDGVELDENDRKVSFSTSLGLELDENDRKVSFSTSLGVELDENHRKVSFSSSPGVELDENHRKVSFSTSPRGELVEKTEEKTAREKQINDLYRKKQQPSLPRTWKDWLKLGAFYKVKSLAITIFPKVHKRGHDITCPRRSETSVRAWCEAVRIMRTEITTDFQISLGTRGVVAAWCDIFADLPFLQTGLFRVRCMSTPREHHLLVPRPVPRRQSSISKGTV